MARTVEQAFAEFMRDEVNLDPNDVSIAKTSKNHLKEIVSGYDDEDFFHLCEDFNEEFGSFARKTKVYVIDDIDLMFGISADGATYDAADPWADVRIYGNPRVEAQRECMDETTGLLNSRMVLNKFKKRLEQSYPKSVSPKRNGEAVQLELKYEWSFDIVPCFRTECDAYGRNYFLIPNGNGGWKKTDPRKDREFVNRVDGKHNGKVLPLIRLCKKWFEHKQFPTPMPYLMETMVARYCDQEWELCERIDYRFLNFLLQLPQFVDKRIMDMKDIQGNINDISRMDAVMIANRAKSDCEKVFDIYRRNSEELYPQYVIGKWREIFGKEFPAYD